MKHIDLPSKDGKYVKIGVSKDVQTSLCSLQTASHSDLQVVGVIETHAPYLIEHALHEVFKNRWVLGEWFDILDLFEES
jgi:hypothetical protein